MPAPHHSLLREFPQFRERIHALQHGSPRFAHLCHEYHELDREIGRIEQEIETPADLYTSDLKKRRVLLKDRLFTLLQTG
jgi:uncharacterized protein YdcH (DUF465 family)